MYNFQQKGMAYWNADDECKKWGGRLVTITSEEEDLFLFGEIYKR